MKGMDHMPSEQLQQLLTLLTAARMYRDGAPQDCDTSMGDFVLARAIAKGRFRGEAVRS